MRTIRVGAHPVIQIEQHRRTLRRRIDQISEPAEHVRTDRFTLVLGEHEPIAAFPRVDVEVIEPEIDEHFLQLSLAVDRAEQLLLGELDDRLVRALPHLGRHLGLAVLGLLLSGRLAPLTTGFHLWDLETGRHLGQAQPDSRQIRKPRL